MKKWKAIALNVKPLVTFCTVDEYDVSDPLIVDDIDGLFEFGVCRLKIVGGELVERSEAEMDAFELEFLADQKITEQRSMMDTIERSSFSYLGIEFPMNAVAHLRYLAMQNQLPTSADVLSSDNRIINIPAAGIPDFVEEYYKEILAITNPV
jgi:hypothetical protein